MIFEKRKILWIVLFLIGISNILFGPEENEMTEEKEKIIKQIAYNRSYNNLIRELEEKSDIYKDKDYFFYVDKMPNEFLEVFLLSTEEIKEKRILIYSMMIVESMGFKEFYNTNADYSTDHGPLMLNSKNIECTDFNSKFFPKDDFIKKLKESNIENLHVLYTAACVNLLRAHIKMYDGNIKKSLKAYNGGPKVNRKRYLGTALDKKTTRYYNKCMRVYNKVKVKYDNFNYINKDKSAFDLYTNAFFNFENEWHSYVLYKKLMSNISVEYYQNHHI